MSLVLDLQKMALDPKSDITELLRKTWFIARKLKVEPLRLWADNELNGYKDGQTVPAYRALRGEVMVLNPYRGWMPVAFETDAASAEAISTLQAGMPVAEIQALLNDTDSGAVWASFPTKVEQYLRSVLVSDTGYQPNFQPKLKIGTPRLHAVLDAVRQQVLDWAMKLEEDGIIGHGMTFDEKEIKMAATHNYTTNNIFQGNVSHAQIQGTAISSSQSMTIGSADFEENLQEIIDNIKTAKGVTSDQLELAEAHADTLKSQAQLTPDKRSSSAIERATKGLSVISTTLSIAKNLKELLPALLQFLS
jgi:hypothetical protein